MIGMRFIDREHRVSDASKLLSPATRAVNSGQTVFLCGPLRISAYLCVEVVINAEVRRDTQRAAEKASLLDFLCKARPELFQHHNTAASSASRVAVSARPLAVSPLCC